MEEWKAQKAVLDRFGLKQTGTFENEIDYNERNPLIVQKKGMKIAFLNYMQGLAHQKDKWPMVNGVSEDIIRRDVALAKEKGADYIVAYFHWGTEFQGYANVVQQKLGQFAVKEGVNLVVGTRPHLVQQFENREVILDGKVQEYIIAYSLGDLYTTAVSHDVNGAIILEVILNKKKSTGKVEVLDFGFIPTYTLPIEKKGRVAWTVLPVYEVRHNNISVSMTKEQSDRMKISADKIKFKLANVIDEIQYELNDQIVGEVAEVLFVTRRPLNEDKNFRLDPQDKLTTYKGILGDPVQPVAVATEPKKVEPPKTQTKPTPPPPAPKPTPAPAPTPEPKPAPPVVAVKEEPKPPAPKPVVKPEDKIPFFEREADEKLMEDIEKIIPVVHEEISKEKASSEVVYRVQFLALRTKIDINTQYYKHLEGYEVVYEEGYYKYLIGQSTNLKTMNDLALDVKRLGHRTAFVVAYRDGVRIKF
jgi:hypothetical protein